MQLFPTLGRNPFDMREESFPANSVETIRVENLQVNLFILEQPSEQSQEIEVRLVGASEGLEAIEISLETGILLVTGKVPQVESAPVEMAANQKKKWQIKGAVNAMKGMSDKIASAMEDNNLVRVIIRVPGGAKVEVDNCSGTIASSGVFLKATVKKDVVIMGAHGLCLDVEGANVTAMEVTGDVTLNVDKGDVFIGSGHIDFANILTKNGGLVNIRTVVNEANLNAFLKGTIYVAVANRIIARNADDKKQIRIGNS